MHREVSPQHSSSAIHHEVSHLEIMPIEIPLTQPESVGSLCVVPLRAPPSRFRASPAMDNRKSEGNAEKVSNSAGIGDICFSTCTTGTMPSRCLDAVLRQYYEPPRGGGACSLSSWPASEMLAVSTANPHLPEGSRMAGQHCPPEATQGSKHPHWSSRDSYQAHA